MADLYNQNLLKKQINTLNIENIIEDKSFLSLKRYKLQLKFRHLPKSVDKTTDLKRENTQWDTLLLKTKLKALDLNETKKWKKGMAFILAKQAVSKFDKDKSNEKLTELYNRCLCLHRSIIMNNSFSKILEDKTNHEGGSPINSYLKRNFDIEELKNVFSKWKLNLRIIKHKLIKVFGEKLNSKAKEIAKLVGIMDNLIKIHEVKTRKVLKMNSNTNIKHSSLNLEDNFTNADSKPIVKRKLSGYSDISFDEKSYHNLESSNSLFNFRPEQNEEELNISRINNELNKIIEDFNKEASVKMKDIVTFRRRSESVNSNNIQDNQKSNLNMSQNQSNVNSTLQGSLGKVNLIGGQNIYSHMKNISELTSQNEKQAKLKNQQIFGFCPTELFYDFEPSKDKSKEESDNTSSASTKASKNDIKPEELSNILSKNIKGTIILYDQNKIFEKFSPSYLIESQNSDSNNCLLKTYFKTIYTIKEKPDKNIIALDSELLSKKFEKKFEVDPGLINQYNLKFEKFTKIQELVLLYAISQYGICIPVLIEILNILPLSKTLVVDQEEICYFLDKCLEHKYGIDMIASNIDNLIFNHKEGFNKCSFYAKKYIFEIESGLLNIFHGDFNYNSKINQNLNSNIDFCYINGLFERFKGKIKRIERATPINEVITQTKEELNTYDESYKNKAINANKAKIVIFQKLEETKIKKDNLLLLKEESTTQASNENKKEKKRGRPPKSKVKEDKETNDDIELLNKKREKENIVELKTESIGNDATIEAIQTIEKLDIKIPVIDTQNAIIQNKKEYLIKEVNSIEKEIISNFIRAIYNKCQITNPITSFSSEYINNYKRFLLTNDFKYNRIKLLSFNPFISKKPFLLKKQIFNEFKKNLKDVSNYKTESNHSLYNNSPLFEMNQTPKTKKAFSINDIPSDYSVRKQNIELTKLMINNNEGEEILDGVAFYSQKSIAKEWDLLRSTWYQNNYQLKPIFRKVPKAKQPELTSAYTTNNMYGYNAGQVTISSSQAAKSVNGNSMIRNLSDH